jgi:CDP-diacylglycerol--glycerol-3-phosphate 3-phosphatidyltransferase
LLLVVVIAIATDWFDGKLARWSKTVSDWGKVLDPLADKMAAGFTLLALAVTKAIPWWFVLMMVVRDVITGLGWSVLSRRTGSIFMSRMSGKAATGAVGVTVLAAIMVADPEVMNACLWITTTLLLYSFVDYFVHFVSVLRGNGKISDGEPTHAEEEIEEAT